jgi:hypothetical protein
MLENGPHAVAGFERILTNATLDKTMSDRRHLVRSLWVAVISLCCGGVPKRLSQKPEIWTLKNKVFLACLKCAKKEFLFGTLLTLGKFKMGSAIFPLFYKDVLEWLCVNFLRYWVQIIEMHCQLELFWLCLMYRSLRTGST